MMSSNTQNRKNASDIGWEHGIKVDNDPRKIKCNYCEEIIPGNIYRFKHHLAGTKKDVKACNSVPHDVEELMFKLLKKSSKRKMINDKEKEIIESVPYKMGKKVTELFSNRTIGTTQSTSNQNFEKGLRDEACRQIARFFHTSGIPFSCAKNPEFAKIFELVGKCGSEFVPPSYHELEKSYVENEMKITTNILEKYKIEWKKTGCSIICDEWTDMKGRFFCNFLVNCSGRTIVLKSIDTSDFSETTIEVCKVLDKIVEEVGEENVVQVITKNTANYKVAVEMLIEKKRGIFWSPCVVQLLDEILEDFEKNLLYHHITIAKGKKIDTFIHSRIEVISMLKKHTNRKDLTGPTITPHVTAYLNLLYLIHMKEPLMKMFSSELELGKTKEGEEIRQIVQDCEFWNDIDVCLKFALPIVEVVLKIDSNEKPIMGFIYEEMIRAQESFQSLNNAKGYQTLWKIFKERSDPLLCSLYKASYYLNPQLHYDSIVKFTRESLDQLYAYLATMAMTYNDNSEVTVENLLQIEHQCAYFSTLKGLFGSQTAIRARDAKDPAEWWDLYGNDCPELQRIAIRLLSLTCSSRGNKQIRNANEQVCSKKRSSSYRRKLNDLFLVIQSFKSKTHKSELRDFSASLPESSSDNELMTKKNVGGVSGTKDILIRGDVRKGTWLRSRKVRDSDSLGPPRDSDSPWPRDSDSSWPPRDSNSPWVSSLSEILLSIVQKAICSSSVPPSIDPSSLSEILLPIVQKMICSSLAPPPTDPSSFLEILIPIVKKVFCLSLVPPPTDPTVTAEILSLENYIDGFSHDIQPQSTASSGTVVQFKRPTMSSLPMLLYSRKAMVLSHQANPYKTNFFILFIQELSYTVVITVIMRLLYI